MLFRSMFLATRFLDVGLIGSLGQNLFKACAIAIGPAGLNAILQHHIGDLGGALAGVFASVIAYALLPDSEARTYDPRVVHVDAANRVVSIGGDPGKAPEGLSTAAIAWASGPR